ncbi:hypothetical protein J9S84_004602 [Salmonella enterica]|uniref:hypothetical protein n=1 Tax=Salmonella enterica TaxID=28901 RepID=UPI00122E2B39|nr:hypothetical protein [Salmonella enterica]EBE2904038.1 hypothetical protein [Salmonella enterica subsp. enterica serovar Krefeld]EDQ2558361.1 hypothetical protein [Salmonella enterica subsp. enterica serovar Langensalza]EDT5367954.1 hypothetical protein [Salmonella enterica subsp. enterica]EAY9603187.1 hypothetical protein [Salmonella enterica]EBH8892856.1 hypothetical protein [Salmonella enterica subsp. enterica serovar Krefeld]
MTEGEHINLHCKILHLKSCLLPMMEKEIKLRGNRDAVQEWKHLSVTIDGTIKAIASRLIQLEGDQ